MKEKAQNKLPTTDFGFPLTCLDLSNSGIRNFYAPVELFYLETYKTNPGKMLSRLQFIRNDCEFPGTLLVPWSIQKSAKFHLFVQLLSALEGDASDSSINLLVFN